MNVQFRVLLVIGAASVAAWACGAPARDSRAPEEYELRGIVKGADVSRCDVDAEDAKVTTKSGSLGVPGENIERLYDIAIDREGAPRVLRCRRVDTDLDGIVDLIRTYDEAGEPYGEQADANLDGQIDTWLRFSRGYVIEQRRDVNADGQPDELRIYSNGRLSRVRKDRDFDGRVDTWEVYDGTRLHRMGVDVDGDGRVDRWDRNADKTPEGQGGKESSVATDVQPSGGEHNAPSASPATGGSDAADDAEAANERGSNESTGSTDGRMQRPSAEVPSDAATSADDGATPGKPKSVEKE